MKRFFYILVLLLTVTLSPALRAQNVQAFASIDSASIMIGDQLTMEVGINIPEGFEVSWPALADTLTSHIEILKKENIDTLAEADRLTLKQKLLITSFDSGFFEIPSISFTFKHGGDTTKFTAGTNKLFLQVYTPVVDTSQAFKVIKGPVSEPYTFKEALPWILLALAIAAIVVFVIWYLRKRKKNQPVFVRKPKPVPPPHITAIKKLEELRLAKIWQQGRLKLYYTQLSDIAREYLEGRYRFNALEMTTDEILETLKESKVNKEVLSKLEASLQLADLVKFAKAQPTALENDLSLSHCVDFVNETKEVQTAPAEAGKDVQPQIEKNK
jgi:hypothetical protein